MVWPPSPVELTAEIGEGGGLSLAWVRRSRLGWSWPDDMALPLGESAERYRVDVQGTAGSLTFSTSEPWIDIPADILAGFAGELTVHVVQVGDFAASRPATTSVLLAA